jgi:toxin FitB
MFLLDTNLVSELRRLSKANPNVAAWAKATPVSHMYLSVVTILEIEQGTLLMERKDKRLGKHLRAWFDDQVIPRFDGRILSVDAAVAKRAARLHVPDPGVERDTLIAATALVHGMTVVTRNVADFAVSGVALLNPWE